MVFSRWTKRKLGLAIFFVAVLSTIIGSTYFYFQRANIEPIVIIVDVQRPSPPNDAVRAPDGTTIVWEDPNGCTHWVTDDGVEGFITPRLDENGQMLNADDRSCYLENLAPVIAEQIRELPRDLANFLIVTGELCKNIRCDGRDEQEISIFAQTIIASDSEQEARVRAWIALIVSGLSLCLSLFAVWRASQD